MSKTYHILYETTNKINGKLYIGVHSTNNINDGYMGSGKLLKHAIKKYGKENFERRVIALFETRSDLLKAESEYVTQKVVESDIYYNVCLGGKSFIDSLANMDDRGAFIEHQRKAGRLGGKAVMNLLSSQEGKKSDWHSKGGKASINSGGYSMSESGKNNIRKARTNSQKYLCPICRNKPMDGGNFNKHMSIKHGVSKNDCYQWRDGAKVDN